MQTTNALILLIALATCGCGDDDSGSASTVDASSGPRPAVDGGLTVALDCFATPTTYLELINACTDAEKVAKTPALPLLTRDGGLPPLP